MGNDSRFRCGCQRFITDGTILSAYFRKKRGNAKKQPVVYLWRGNPTGVVREWVREEICRRTRGCGIFIKETSCFRLVRPLAGETSEEWQDRISLDMGENSGLGCRGVPRTDPLAAPPSYSGSPPSYLRLRTRVVLITFSFGESAGHCPVRVFRARGDCLPGAYPPARPDSPVRSASGTRMR